jgi:hypothetical protein
MNLVQNMLQVLLLQDQEHNFSMVDQISFYTLKDFISLEGKKKKNCILTRHAFTDFLMFRYNIRGTFHVVFYGLPEDPLYYTEIVNFLGLKFDEASAAEEATFSCTALFSKYDFLKLERVLGTERAKKMCTAQKNVFMFA